MKIRVAKHGFDEQDVGRMNERLQAQSILFVTADVSDVTELLAGHELEQVALQLAE
jgi:hypothetical protein